MGTSIKTENKIFIVAFILCGVFLLCSLLFVNSMKQQNKEQSEIYVVEEAAHERASLDQQIEGNFQIMRGVSISLGAMDLSNMGRIEEVLAEINQNNEFVRMGVADLNGRVNLLDIDGSIYYNVNFKEFSFFQQALTGEEAISEVTTSVTTGKYVNYYAVPVIQDGEIVNILCAVKEADALTRILDIPVFHGKGLYTVIDENGKVVTVTPDAEKLRLIRGSQIKNSLAFTPAQKKAVKGYLEEEKAGTFSVAIGGENCFGVVEPLQTQGWFLIGLVFASDVDEYFSETTLGMTLIIVAACAIFLFLMYHQRRIMTRNQRALEYIAYTDLPTGMRNYTKFQMDATKIMDNYPNHKYAVWSLDVKQSRMLNDMFGYQTGEEITRKLASVLKEEAGKLAICCHMSVDEFVGIMPYEEREDLETWFNLLEKRVDTSGMLSSDELSVSIAAGFYCMEDFREITQINDMVNRAGIARKTIKEVGGSEYAIFSEEMSELMRWEAELNAAGRVGLDNDEFTFFLQPKVAIQDGYRIVGAEALARWNRPGHGWISPAEFIPVFEQSGAVILLDRYIFEQACKWYRNYLDQGNAPINLAVNLSRTGLLREDLIDFYVSTKEKYGLKDEEVELELTESVVLEDYDLFRNRVKELQKNGFRCAIDDFGSGYSSLNVLKSLPIQVLKLDAAFFRGKGSQQRAETIVAGFVRMAKELNIRTVAEGVEDVDQVHFLQEAGCDEIQGYYFSKPLPVDEFMKLIKRMGGKFSI